MNDVVIRRRCQADLAALADVLVRVHARDGYPVEGVDNPEAWIAPPAELAAWVAVYGAEVIGHVALANARDTDDAAMLWQRATGGQISRLAILARLFVDPRYRNVGAGSLLMKAARAFADEHDLAVAFDVMLKDRDAIRLYEKLGYQRLGTVGHEHSGGKAEAAAVYFLPSNHPTN
ncbi:Acetyltransferase (GNAT) family [Mycobacteroides abscessus]|uniref:GNAT family N-acetyltransferase n=1 Tax=Mycolicibacterium phocaicum TaxID=319706 RepID=A0A7I7ZPR6_9MYCO|nr:MULTISPECIES: GNAT family N-acetyltransferase [Mycobacteriaceae]MDO3136747.1 GNAT family N-acetyltransferase [Mycobacteroides abscessus subsp. abscessus]MDO3152027.1 GNAT family N-acetyltransferase [Mycobacteroides abscessus subsp. abscessus]NOS21289.1 GNAT family N-acetyltransferase [Mycobacteroides abscessus]RIR64034.1 GNAT family N-acetyltransferase [Mycobacteroides abscessus]TLH74420.1 GNAT family N-acetyltransferase [Mycolicibacterium phocaicum]